jgi:hypothetical protein
MGRKKQKIEMNYQINIWEYNPKLKFVNLFPVKFRVFFTTYEGTLDGPALKQSLFRMLT